MYTLQSRIKKNMPVTLTLCTEHGVRGPSWSLPRSSHVRALKQQLPAELLFFCVTTRPSSQPSIFL